MLTQIIDTAVEKHKMQKECRLMYAHLNAQWMDAKNEGIEEGVAKGAAKKAASTARAMLADSLPVATIVRYTGLTQEEVLALQRGA